MKTHKFSYTTDAQIRAEIGRLELVLEKRAVLRRINGRTPIGYFYFCGGDERHTDYELHVVFSNKTKECWSFSTYDHKHEGTRDAFRRNHFSNVRLMKWDEWDKMRPKKY